MVRAMPRFDERPLGDACVTEAMAIIAADGPEALSLREVARRLGVSHQAPYKHYPTRDHLMAEVVRRCFRRFAAALDGGGPTASAEEDMRALGAAYLGFALGHPLEYRLMFGMPWPAGADHPDLVRDARFAFDVLRERLGRLYAHRVVPAARVDGDAMFVWSSMHGLATILASDATAVLDLSPDLRARLPEHVMGMIDRALPA
jgi:AcrR family transcriptional regulator